MDKKEKKASSDQPQAQGGVESPVVTEALSEQEREDKSLAVFLEHVKEAKRQFRDQVQQSNGNPTDQTNASVSKQKIRICYNGCKCQPAMSEEEYDEFYEGVSCMVTGETFKTAMGNNIRKG